MSLHGYSDHEYEAEPTLISKLDLSSPLHLHLNDSATLIVISMKLKGSENYQVWSCAMLLALEGKNKTGFIDGSCRRSNADEVLGRKWDRVNAVVLGWILNSISEELLNALCNILSRDELPDVRSAYAIISSEESHRVVSSSGAGSSQRSQSSVFNSNVRNRNNANVTRPVSNSRPSNVTRHVNNRNRRPNGGLPWLAKYTNLHRLELGSGNGYCKKKDKNEAQRTKPSTRMERVHEIKADDEFILTAYLIRSWLAAIMVAYYNADWADTLSRSSAEAEYRGVANDVAETSWIHNLLRELHILFFTATLVYCDNVSAVYMSANPVQHQHTKHREIGIHFVHDKVAACHVRVFHVPSGFQYADIFTKKLTNHIDGTTAPSATITSGDQSIPNPTFTTWNDFDQRTVILLNSSLTEEAAAEVLGLTRAHANLDALETADSNSSV
ncbi:ribonuclease H-like domain-containing protein [Tanacetum coccineum]